MSASRGVIRADDGPGLEAACRRAGAIIGASADAEERNALLVESFVPGSEIALEGMLTGGELSVLAVFDKPDPLDGPFFEETLYVTPSRLPRSVQALVAGRVHEGCAAYGLTEGPVHAELRIHDGDAWIIEIAGRTIGGDCARLFTLGAGIGLEHLVLQRALGWPLDVPFCAAGGAVGVLMIPTPGRRCPPPGGGASWRQAGSRGSGRCRSRCARGMRSHRSPKAAVTSVSYSHAARILLAWRRLFAARRTRSG